MKKLMTFMVLCSLLVSFGSCDKPELVEDEKTEQEGTTEGEGNTEGDGGEEGGADEGNTEVDKPVIDMGEFEDPTNPRVPIGWSDIIAEGSEVGVTIEIKQLETQNFVFELRPGALVQSFRLDVYPLAHLYNYLLNDGMYDKEQWEVQEQIRTYMFNEEGSGAYTFSINDFENPEDFLQIQFDWMNTAYSKVSAIVIPDCSYIIAVVGCTDEGGYDQQDLTLCHVHTPSYPLVGDPGCEIEVNTGYQAFSVNHILNADAAGVYYFGGLADEIDAYIDLYGDVMMRDFVRTRLSSPVAAGNTDALYYNYDYGQYADPTIQSATLAVCCDANLTPQEGYSRRDFHLKEVPEDIEEGTVAIEIVEERVAAAYFEFDAKFSASCNTIFYRFYSEAQKAELEAASDLDKMREAIDLRNSGYGCHNPNFAWDSEAEQPVGTSAVVRIPQWGMEFAPGETFYVGYTGRNGALKLTGLEFSEPVTLDQRNLSSPDNCKVKDLNLVLSDASRNSFDYEITYDPSTVSMVYCQYYTADNNPGLDQNSSWNDWVNFIFTPSSTGTGSSMHSNILVNVWPTLNGGRDAGGWAGMVPGTEYTVYLCAEDFDGNVSAMCFDTITTQTVQVGPDPTVKMEFLPFDDYNYLGQYCDWQVAITLQHDVEYIRYTHFTEAADLLAELPTLTLSGFRDIANSGISYQDWVDALYTLTLGEDGEGGGLKTDGNADVTWAGDDVVIVTCVAVGRNDNGTPAYNFFHLVCQDGKATTLEEIFGVTE